ncbi:Fis family transcriptional regulator, partial [Streptomyces rubellomurinus subsp. indigoferus]
MSILLLSARQSSAAKVEALDAGADDSVTKPFGMGELLSRMRAAVRRAEPVAGEDDSLVVTESFT